MDFEKYLQESAGETDREVKKILDNEVKSAKETHDKLVPLMKAFIEFSQGGKRIRGALVVLGYEIGKKSSVISRQSSDCLTAESEAVLKTDSSILKVAAALEICHAAILVQDDIMDKSLTRRDKPSLYAALGGNHRGISQAISLADFGFFLAYKTISESKFDADKKTNALAFFSQVMMDTSWGQMLDLEEVDPFTVAKLKTSRYTIAGPLEMGAVLAGADKKAREVLEEFGSNLGIVYQIQDDILDNESNRWGGVKCAKEEAEKYRYQAMKMLPQITKDPKMSKILEQLAEYLVERTK